MSETKQGYDELTKQIVGDAVSLGWFFNALGSVSMETVWDLVDWRCLQNRMVNLSDKIDRAYER